MISIQELRVTNTGDRIVIGANVRQEPYYNNVYIDKVIIDTEETYNEGGPSSKPVFTKQFEGNIKSINLQLNKLDLGGSEPTSHLFFIYVVAKGTPAPDTPCGMDNINTLGITMYMGTYYNNFMNYIDEMNNSNCTIPKGLIDQILRYEALNVSLDSGHYIKGIEYFNKWFNKTSPVTVTSNCGCHG